MSSLFEGVLCVCARVCVCLFFLHLGSCFKNTFSFGLGDLLLDKLVDV